MNILSLNGSRSRRRARGFFEKALFSMSESWISNFLKRLKRCQVRTFFGLPWDRAWILGRVCRLSVASSVRRPAGCRRSREGLPTVRFADREAVDQRRPMTRTRHRPCGEQRSGFGVAVRRPPQTAEPPRLGLLREPGPQGVPFHIPADGVEMLVVLYRERFESSLVDVPATGRGVYAQRWGWVSVDSADEFRQRVVFRGCTSRCQ